MRRSVQPAGKQTNLVNDAHKEPNADNGQSKDKTSEIACMDNGTMVEAFKYLNYCQLAKNSLVSNRFRNLIQTHRHKLALLYVDRISMYGSIAYAAVKIYDKELSPEAYNEWVISNSYSKQVPVEDEIATTQSTQNISNGYGLYAYAHYKDPSHRECYDRTSVFSAQVEFNHENWPLFQHFVRLVSDPFIYSRNVELTNQNDVLNLLDREMNSDHKRLQSKKLVFNLGNNTQTFITWIKNHVRCNKFYIRGETESNNDEALLDFIVTGAHCTSSITVFYRDLSKAVVDFLQKFMDIKSSGESQLIEAIEGYFKGQAVELFKLDYADFLVKEEKDDHIAELVFEFVNNDVKKKLQLTLKTYEFITSYFSIKINNL